MRDTLTTAKTTGQMDASLLGRCVWVEADEQCIYPATAHDEMCDPHRAEKKRYQWAYRALPQAREMMRCRASGNVAKAAKKLLWDKRFRSFARSRSGHLNRGRLRDLACVALASEMYSERPLIRAHLDAAAREGRIYRLASDRYFYAKQLAHAANSAHGPWEQQARPAL